MGKYFGTDGFRGKAGVDLTAEHAFQVGRFLGWYYSRKHTEDSARIVIGKDTRRSSYMFENALAAGITSSGADAYLLHVTTTPCVSYITRTENFDCGVMISASHNPFYDNGIKLMNGVGEKMDDALQAELEAFIDGDPAYLPWATEGKVGKTIDFYSGRNRYIGYLTSLPSRSFEKHKVGLDCANGSSWMIGRAVFDALGAKTYVINDQPDGVNINTDCGSTHIEGLQLYVREHHLDVGFAFDGDADRCLTVDEQGNPIDGDRMMAICAESLEQKGRLQGDGFVATVMSNIGLHRFCKERGLRLLCANVGDRNVLELMQKEGMRLGGEQSGHIIFLDYMPTGDGQLAALQLLSILSHSKKKASELASAVRQYPQLLKNVRVSSNDQKTAIMQSASLQSAIRAAEEELGENGRVLIRPSGTEPLIRVMVEAGTQQQAQAVTDRLVQHVENLQKTTDK